MLIDGGLLPEDFATERQHIAEERIESRKWSTLLGKRLVQLGADLCHVKFRRRFDPNDTAAKDPLWSDLLYYFNYYFTLKLMAALYLQFAFDYHRYKLDKFDQVAVGEFRGLLPAEQKLYRAQLVAEYEQARQASKTIGAPLMHMNYWVENVFIFLILLVSGIYLISQFLNRLDVAIVYLLLAPHQLQRSIDALVRHGVNKYIISSRTYNEIELSKILESEHEDDGRHQGRKYASQFRRYTISINHKVLAEQAKAMARNGMFQPYSRREDRIKEMADMYGLFTVLVHLATAGFWILFTLIIPALTMITNDQVEADWMDLLFYAELLLYSLIGSSTASTYLTGAIMMCLDQVYSIYRLCGSINDCVFENTRTVVDHLSATARFNRAPLGHNTLVEPSYIRIPIEGSPTNGPRSVCRKRISISQSAQAASHDQVSRQISSSLLHRLLYYKMFVRQLRSHFVSFRLYTSVAMFLMFALPLMTRVLIAYLDESQQRLSVCASLIITAVIDSSLVSICWLHERCLDIYRQLQSLMAHTIAMDNLVEVHTNRRAYDGHLIQMLRRELAHPEKLNDQFSTRMHVVQTNLTYASLIRYHFWWGILTLSTIIIDPSLPHARDIFGGVWRYYSCADADVYRLFANSTELPLTD